jgi:signal transduction histidine kinase/CheY-like chemotaxis protein
VSAPLLSVRLRYEEDVVLARQRARQIAAALGFDVQHQTRIATAVSEIARNAFRYAREGHVEFSVEGSSRPQLLCVVVADRGPGIADLPAVLEGRYRSTTGMGAGIRGAQRLMDRFVIESSPERGTTVELRKLLPRETPLLGPEAMAAITDRLAREKPQNAVEEVQQQNQELLRALGELTRRQHELAAVNRELEDTNRGVVALYAELDERADHLRRADDIKTRFISNMSHEFRTPVNSIQALARLMLDRTDGELTVEQERQMLFIRQAADALSELVNDLLDLAKIEAGKTVVHASEFQVADLFSALRGMLRPLLVGEAVSLVFEEPEGLPTLNTDEGKVSQILRNFISNALKFTMRGEVRVSTEVVDDGGAVVFRVTDTGIGIAPEDQERIFQEFTQVENPLQRTVKGTGLGLPLCRRLAELLGGYVAVESQEGIGSTFSATIPTIYASAGDGTPKGWQLEPMRMPVLVIEDSAETVLLYEKYLAGSGFQVLPAATLREARQALAAVRPRAIILDVMLRGEDSWDFLSDMKRRHETRSIPILVVTRVEDERKAIALGADGYCVKPIDRHRLVHALTRITAPEALRRILIVDDEEISRYLLRQHLMAPEHVIWEATNAEEAMRIAREERPDVICLDVTIPDVDGYEILRRLKAEPTTRDVPVVMVTAQALDEEQRRRLAGTASVLSKERLSRVTALAAIQSAIQQRERAA